MVSLCISSFCSRWLGRSGPEFCGREGCGGLCGFGSFRLFLFRTGVQHSTPGSGNAFFSRPDSGFLVAVKSWSSLSSPAVGGKAQILSADELKKRPVNHKGSFGGS